MIHHQGKTSLIDGLFLMSILLMGMMFEADIWPDKSKVKQEDYVYVVLDSAQTAKAIDKARMEIYLEDIGYYKRPIVFKDTRLPLKTFSYYLQEHFIKLILVGLLAFHFRGIYAVFFYLQVADVVDLWLVYNTVYARYGGIPLSYNTISVLLFGFVILKQWIQRMKAL